MACSSAHCSPRPVHTRPQHRLPIRTTTSHSRHKRAGRTRVDRAAGVVPDRGIYLNDSGRLVVTVTDSAAAQAVRDAGGVPEMVTYSSAHLESIRAELRRSARIPGTSWGVDPDTNQMWVAVDSTVTGAKLAQLESVTKRFGDAVRVDRVAGKFALTAGFTSGGQGIENLSGKWWCTLGFNVQDSDGVKYFLTAGHCVEPTYSWYKRSNHDYLGWGVDYRFPGRDFGLVLYDRSRSTVRPTRNRLGQRRRAADNQVPLPR